MTIKRARGKRVTRSTITPQDVLSQLHNRWRAAKSDKGEYNRGYAWGIRQAALDLSQFLDATTYARAKELFEEI